MIRKTACLMVIFSLIFFACEKTEYREVTQYTIEQFMDTVSISRGSSFSHGEKTILFSTNKTGIYNAFTIPVEGGEPTQLTYSEDDAIFALSFFPEDNRTL